MNKSTVVRQGYVVFYGVCEDEILLVSVLNLIPYRLNLLECARCVSGAGNVRPIEIVLGLPKIHSALRLFLSLIWGFKALWGN